MSAQDQVPREATKRGRSGGRAATSIEVQRELEQLRQERDTFDQRKRQDAHWFQLRMAMGILAMIIIVALIVICVFLLSSSRQSGTVKSLAASALLIDILGLAAAVWKIVLNPASLTRLSPVTASSPNSIGNTRKNSH